MSTGNNAEKSISRVLEAEENSEFLRAADHAETALETLADHLSAADRATLQYHFVRCVARGGAANRAALLYKRFEIGKRADLDSQALWPKILKGQAFERLGTQRIKKLHDAARAYEEVYDRELNSYPCVNAASLFSLAGDKEKAFELAGKTLAACTREEEAADPPGPSYWSAVTVAEAALVLGDMTTAKKQLQLASTLTEEIFYAHLATTRKQLRLLCENGGHDTSLLDFISLPDVIFFAGHIIAAPGKKGRFPASEEKYIQDGIKRFLDENEVGFAYGSLASGGDLLIAEECIRRNIEVHAVLPFRKSDFLELSVQCSGPGWVERFETVYDHIEKQTEADRGSITYATTGAYMGDDSLFGYCADFAMGLAMVRARALDADIKMLTIYDGKGGPGFGTNSNLERWQALDLPAHAIAPRGNAAPSVRSKPQKREFPSREPRAILFGDVKHFSKLTEEMLPLFHSEFMYKISEILNSYGEKVLYSNTWGDAIYAVFDNPGTAARCGLDFQNMITKTDFKALGLVADLSLRLSIHYGPVFRGTDFIRNEPTYFGSHVTMAARIEPITPPGEIYVTEAFAAALTLESDAHINCDYMGTLSMAKDFGTLRMYVIKLRK